MAAAIDDPGTATTTMIDEIYEFSAPRFFDFVTGETHEDSRKAELWFDTAFAYAPSPFMPRIKAGRSVTVGNLCDFSEADQIKTLESSSSSAINCSLEADTKKEKVTPNEAQDDSTASLVNVASNCSLEADTKKEKVTPNEAQDDSMTSLVNVASTSEETYEADHGKGLTCSQESGRETSLHVETEVTNNENIPSSVQVRTGVCCTPNLLPPETSRKADLVTNSKKHQTAKKIASLIRNSSATTPKTQLQSSQFKGIKPPSSVKRGTNLKPASGTPILAQENQAIKRQKLDCGKSRQILDVKPRDLLHKSKLGIASGSSNTHPSFANRTSKEDRKVYVREPAAPFVSMAEMMKKFQSSTRDLSLPQPYNSLTHMKPKLTLTRPKEPDFETSQRVRSVKVKSSAELEEEMMAKIPKFKARPLKKKILEAPTLPVLHRTAPQPPQFQEFHLETMERANKNAESTSVASTESSHQRCNQWKPHLVDPKTPVLLTSLRARPTKVKSSFELELEELKKFPKFKAKPLNKKIFESKGGLGIFYNEKKQITKPQEFHFATNERIPPPPAAAVSDLFDKLSLNSEPCRTANHIPRITRPNPFYLQTEERGAEKVRRFFTEVLQKQIEEEQARIPKAKPYPYTTDYPVIPPKPEPKQHTKPEPFQLESLARHEEELQREMEERRRMEKEEAQRRMFKAQPILKEDPIPVPEKVRRPLTQVEDFNLHVDHRAVDRAEFDKKIKEKEMMYKRYREESESARMMEEEKELKQLRRTLVPHARPMPKFREPFLPQKSNKETTKPKSPKLKVLERRERRKFLSTSAAANMR